MNRHISREFSLHIVTGDVARQFSEASWRRRAGSLNFFLEKLANDHRMLSGSISGRFRVSFSFFLLKFSIIKVPIRRVKLK